MNKYAMSANQHGDQYKIIGENTFAQGQANKKITWAGENAKWFEVWIFHISLHICVESLRSYRRVTCDMNKFLPWRTLSRYRSQRKAVNVVMFQYL